jgi:hypothetical protein
LGAIRCAGTDFPQSATAKRVRGDDVWSVSDVAITVHSEVIAIEVKEALTRWA